MPKTFKLRPIPKEQLQLPPEEQQASSNGNYSKPQKNWGAITALVAIALGGVNTLFLMFISFSVHGISSRPPMHIESKDGKIIEVSQADYLARSPQSIKEFLRLEMSLLWNWESFDPKVRCDDPAKDRCTKIMVGNKRIKVPLTLLAAEEGLSFSQTDSFGPDLIREIALLIPSEVFAGRMAQQFRELYLGEPTPIQGQPGRWSLRMRSTRIMKLIDGRKRAIDFNRELFIRAIDPKPGNPIRKYGLEIYAMRPLDTKDYE